MFLIGKLLRRIKLTVGEYLFFTFRFNYEFDDGNITSNMNKTFLFDLDVGINSVV